MEASDSIWLEILEIWKIQKGPQLTHSSIITYEPIILEWIRWATKKRIEPSQIQFSILQNFLVENWGHLRPQTRRKKMMILKSFFKWLLEDYTLQPGWSLAFQGFKNPKILPRSIPWDELKPALEEAWQNHQKNPDDPVAYQNWMLFWLLYGCGLRVSEACQLKWIDWNPSYQSFYVIGKGSKWRQVPVILFWARWFQKEILPKWSQVHPQILLGMNRFQAWKMLKQWNPNWHPHRLRHSFATHCLQNGLNLRFLQEILGHSRLTSTAIYTHLDWHDLSKVIDDKHPYIKGLKASNT